MKKSVNLLLLFILLLSVSGCTAHLKGISYDDPSKYPINAIAKADFACDDDRSLGVHHVYNISKGTVFAVTALPYKINNSWGANSDLRSLEDFPENTLGVPYDMEQDHMTAAVSNMMIIYPDGSLATSEHFICYTEKGYCRVLGGGCQELEGGNFDITNK